MSTSTLSYDSCVKINNQKIIALILIGIGCVGFIFTFYGFQLYNNELKQKLLYSNGTIDAFKDSESSEFTTSSGKYILDESNDQIYIYFNLTNIDINAQSIYFYLDFDSNTESNINLRLYTCDLIDDNIPTNLTLITSDLSSQNNFVNIETYIDSSYVEIIFLIRLDEDDTTAIINSLNYDLDSSRMRTSLVRNKIIIPEWIEYIEIILYLLFSIVIIIGIGVFISNIIGDKRTCKLFERKNKIDPIL